MKNSDKTDLRGLLVVSFGTSYNDSRRLTIGAIESAMEEAFTDYSVRRAFTSGIIIRHLYERDGEAIDDVGKALGRAVSDGVKTMVIQPTHMISGLEYDDLCREAAQYADAFTRISVGQPLLTSDEDFKAVMEAVTEWTADYDDDKTAVVLMGHGTGHDANEAYHKMQDLLRETGHDNYYVGTVEATPSPDDVLSLVQEGNYTRVVLEPLMVVAGDHANNDMAGDGEGSWKRSFEEAGYEVKCLIRGLGENEAIRRIYVRHAQAAMDALSA